MTARINGYNPIGICYDPPQFSNGHRRGYSYTPFYRGATDEPDCDTDDSGMIKYFNDPDVQKQLHVDALNWSPCSDKIWQLYTFGTTTIPLFESFKEAGLKMMFYSGNVDAVVPLLETQEYLKRIGWAVTSPAAVLLNPRGSLEGWITKYENNLSLYVINAAGHMVPCEKPYAALRMFEGFIQGKF
jgi:serine carboxypeptidase-like clade II